MDIITNEAVVLHMERLVTLATGLTILQVYARQKKREVHAVDQEGASDEQAFLICALSTCVQKCMPGENGDLNWVPKVAPWRLAILAKLVKITRGLAIMAKTVPSLGDWRFWWKWRFQQKPPEGWWYPGMWQIFKLAAKSGPLELDN